MRVPDSRRQLHSAAAPELVLIEHRNASTHMRQCPTFGGDVRPLITHQIRVPLCMDRQRGFYHKCHRCAYRGKGAAFTLDDPAEQDRDPASPVRLKPAAKD